MVNPSFLILTMSVFLICVDLSMLEFVLYSQLNWVKRENYFNFVLIIMFINYRNNFVCHPEQLEAADHCEEVSTLQVNSEQEFSASRVSIRLVSVFRDVNRSLWLAWKPLSHRTRNHDYFFLQYFVFRWMVSYMNKL